jgi:hypothetical protein
MQFTLEEIDFSKNSMRISGSQSTLKKLDISTNEIRDERI